MEEQALSTKRHLASAAALAKHGCWPSDQRASLNMFAKQGFAKPRGSNAPHAYADVHRHAPPHGHTDTRTHGHTDTRTTLHHTDTRAHAKTHRHRDTRTHAHTYCENKSWIYEVHRPPPSLSRIWRSRMKVVHRAVGDNFVIHVITKSFEHAGVDVDDRSSASECNNLAVLQWYHKKERSRSSCPRVGRCAWVGCGAVMCSCGKDLGINTKSAESIVFGNITSTLRAHKLSDRIFANRCHIAEAVSSDVDRVSFTVATQKAYSSSHGQVRHSRNVTSHEEIHVGHKFELQTIGIERVLETNAFGRKKC